MTAGVPQLVVELVRLVGRLVISRASMLLHFAITFTTMAAFVARIHLLALISARSTEDSSPRSSLAVRRSRMRTARARRLYGFDGVLGQAAHANTPNVCSPP